MRKFFCILLFICSIASASEMCLKEKLALATEGSYLVIEQNKTYIFFHIHTMSTNAIVIEEVFVPTSTFAKKPMNWKEWFETGAPGHTCWIMSRVNLQTAAFEETFSFTRQGWIDMSESAPFLTTLLNLRFHEVSFAERRKIGQPHGHNKTDTRPVWNPRLIVNNQIVSNAAFTAYKARWPADGSELARKVVEIYLPDTNQDTTSFPLCFPYWLEIEGKFSGAKIRVIDSGIYASSPKGAMPRRPIQLLGDIKKDDKGLHIQIKSPSYYHQFILLAEGNDTFFGHFFPIPCEVIEEGKEIVSLHVSPEELKKLSDQESSYRLMLSPKENPLLVLEIPL